MPPMCPSEHGLEVLLSGEGGSRGESRLALQSTLQKPERKPEDVVYVVRVVHMVAFLLGDCVGTEDRLLL